MTAKCHRHTLRLKLTLVSTTLSKDIIELTEWFHGVMVSTLDSESSDPSSNLGGTFHFVKSLPFLGSCCWPWILHFISRDSSVGRALDWRSKGPRFDPGSRQLHFCSPCHTNLFAKKCRPTWGSNPRPWDFFFCILHLLADKHIIIMYNIYKAVLLRNNPSWSCKCLVCYYTRLTYREKGVPDINFHQPQTRVSVNRRRFGSWTEWPCQKRWWWKEVRQWNCAATQAIHFLFFQKSI